MYKQIDLPLRKGCFQGYSTAVLETHDQLKYAYHSTFCDLIGAQCSWTTMYDCVVCEISDNNTQSCTVGIFVNHHVYDAYTYPT